MKLVNDWYLPDNDTHFIDPDTYHNNKIEKVKEYLTGNDVFIDIGAHVGIITIKFAPLFHKIYAFEPESTNYECLVENIKRRHLTNVVTYNFALSDYIGCCNTKKLSKTGNSGNFAIKPGDKIKCFTLDNFYFYHWDKQIDLLKIDTQGTEAKILKGATRTLKKTSTIWIEQDDNLDGKTFLIKNNFQQKEIIGNNYIFIR